MWPNCVQVSARTVRRPEPVDPLVHLFYALTEHIDRPRHLLELERPTRGLDRSCDCRRRTVALVRSCDTIRARSVDTQGTSQLKADAPSVLLAACFASASPTSFSRSLRTLVTVKSRYLHLRFTAVPSAANSSTAI